MLTYFTSTPTLARICLRQLRHIYHIIPPSLTLQRPRDSPLSHPRSTSASSIPPQSLVLRARYSQTESHGAVFSCIVCLQLLAVQSQSLKYFWNCLHVRSALCLLILRGLCHAAILCAIDAGVLRRTRARCGDAPSNARKAGTG